MREQLTMLKELYEEEREYGAGWQQQLQAEREAHLATKAQLEAIATAAAAGMAEPGQGLLGGASRQAAEMQEGAEAAALLAQQVSEHEAMWSARLAAEVSEHQATRQVLAGVEQQLRATSDRLEEEWQGHMQVGIGGGVAGAHAGGHRRRSSRGACGWAWEEEGGGGL